MVVRPDLDGCKVRRGDGVRGMVVQYLDGSISVVGDAELDSLTIIVDHDRLLAYDDRTRGCFTRVRLGIFEWEDVIRGHGKEGPVERV